MLDYAANAVLYWPLDRLMADFEERCRDSELDPEAELLAFLAGSCNTGEFWERVKTNLQAGRVRMLFVADEIPSELRRIVEFLNEQMDPAEVLAVEIRQFVGQGMRTLVPRVMGQTAEAEKRKGSVQSAARTWNEATFFEALRASKGDAACTVARRLLDWARPIAKEIAWGRGKQAGSFIPVFAGNGVEHYPFAVYTYGRMEVQFCYLANKPPFAAEEKRRELLQRLNAIPDISLPDDAISRRPSIPLMSLTNESTLQQYLDVIKWAVEQM